MWHRFNAYLASNVVREPVQTLIEPFTRGRTCALNVPVSAIANRWVSTWKIYKSEVTEENVVTLINK